MRTLTWSLATLALAHVTAALLAQENQNPGSPGLAAYIELQGAALGEVSSINAGITASTTRQCGDSFRKSGQAIPEQTTALTAAAQQAFDSNDYYRAFRLNARAAGWSRGPKCLGLVARFPELRFALQPAIARNGALYFMAHAAGPLHDFGIYRAELVNGEYAKPQLLPRSINLPPFLNWTPFIAPDESYLLFSSNRHSPDTDAGDLYIGRHLVDGNWTDPVSLGEPVNSERQERFPMISPDGKYLFFTRPTPGHEQDVNWVSAETVEKLKAKADGRLEPKKASDPHGPATSEVSFAEPKESILVN